MKLLRVYLCLLRRTPWWNPIVFVVFAGAHNAYDPGVLERGAQDPFATAIVAGVVVCFGFLTLIIYLESFRRDWYRVLRTLPVRRSQLDAGIWAVYVLAAPLFVTLCLYVGVRPYAHNASPWIVITAFLNVLLVVVAIHALFFAVATISTDIVIRIVCAGGCTVVLLVAAVAMQPYLQGLQSAAAWCIAALAVSYARKSRMWKIAPHQEALLAEGMARDVDVAALVNAIADAKRTTRPQLPPPLPRTGGTEARTRHAASSPVPSPAAAHGALRARLIGVTTLIVGICISGLCLFALETLNELPSGSATALTFGWACAATGLALSLERRRTPVYRTLPVTARCRATYAWLVGALPCGLVFLLAMPALLLGYGEPPTLVLTAFLTANAIATHFVAGMLPGTKAYDPVLGQTRLLNRVYLASRPIPFVATILLVIVLTNNGFLSSATFRYLCAVLVPTSALHFYVYHVRMRGI